MKAELSYTSLNCAILLCSTMVSPEEKLVDYTYHYLTGKGFPVEYERVLTMVDRHNIGAKLYGNYRNHISKIQTVSLIQEIYRALWLYAVVASSYRNISPADLLLKVNQKYEEECIYKKSMDSSQYICFRLIDKNFRSRDTILSNGEGLCVFLNDFPLALSKLFQTFEELSEYKFMNAIYKVSDTGAFEANSDSVLCKPNTGAMTEKPAYNTPEATRDDSISRSGIELQLRDEIQMLKNDIHKLQVELSYAKKDAVRDFLRSLTSYGWNSPLSELYRLIGDEETPEKLRGIITNLFMALGAENIKICRDKVGSIIELSEDNQKNYVPFKNEEIFIGDKAEIYYPGFRYEREVMIRPVVRKKGI